MDLVHAAVRRNLRKSDTFSQIQTAYHADAADIRPRRSLLDRCTEHIARCATVHPISDVLTPSWATLRWYASQRSLRFTRALPFDEAKLTPGVLPAGGSSSAALH